MENITKDIKQSAKYQKIINDARNLDTVDEYIAKKNEVLKKHNHALLKLQRAISNVEEELSSAKIDRYKEQWIEAQKLADKIENKQHENGLLNIVNAGKKYVMIESMNNGALYMERVKSDTYNIYKVTEKYPNNFNSRDYIVDCQNKEIAKLRDFGIIGNVSLHEYLDWTELSHLHKFKHFSSTYVDKNSAISFHMYYTFFGRLIYPNYNSYWGSPTRLQTLWKDALGIYSSTHLKFNYAFPVHVMGDNQHIRVYENELSLKKVKVVDSYHLTSTTLLGILDKLITTHVDDINFYAVIIDQSLRSNKKKKYEKALEVMGMKADEIDSEEKYEQLSNLVKLL